MSSRRSLPMWLSMSLALAGGCKSVSTWVWPATDAGAGDAAGALADLPPVRDLAKASAGDAAPVTAEQVLIVGPGGALPFDPSNDRSSQVELDGAGNLRRTTTDGGGMMGPAMQSTLWVANSGEGTVSKIDTRTMKEIARYDTYPGRGADPSRTTVSLQGDLVVANRSAPMPDRASVVKIAGDLSSCVDRNGNGQIDTSSGSTTLPWPAGQAQSPDECVLWLAPMPKGSLPRAAGWNADSTNGGQVYIGLFGTRELWRLSGRDGSVLAKINVAPATPYGLVIDARANIWLQGLTHLVKVDPSQGDAVKLYASSACMYGITADSQGRIYTSGGTCVARFDPATETWETLRIPTARYNRGVAVDRRMGVWIADSSVGMHHVDAAGATMTNLGSALSAGSNEGAAVDLDGNPWLISGSDKKAFRVDPATYSLSSVPIGFGSYTYSDMTGYQLRNATGATNPPAFYTKTITACNGGFPSAGPSPVWVNLGWTASLPADSSIQLRARGAQIANGLFGPWTLVATAPLSTSPAPLSLPTANVLQVEVSFIAGAGGESPLLTSLRVGYTCPRPVDP